MMLSVSAPMETPPEPPAPAEPPESAPRDAPVFAGRPKGDTTELERRIIDAAWRVVTNYGADLFSVDQVAREARTSKRTIYARFGSKAALIRRMVERGATDYLAALRQRFNADGLRAMLEEQARLGLQYMSSPEGKALARLMSANAPLAEGAGETFEHSAHRAACAGVEQMLRDAQERGEIHIDNLAFAASFWIESLIGHGRVANAQAAPVEDWAREHAAIFLRSLRP